MNPRPTGVKRTTNNKPQLCKDLELAFRDMHGGAAAAEIKQMSIQLERDVLKHVLSRQDKLGCLINGLTFGEFPEGDDASSVVYGSRFINNKLQQDILEIIRRTLGPDIRSEWVTSQQQQQ